MSGRGAIRVGVAAAIAAALAGCNTVQSMLAPAGEQADRIEWVWRVMLWVCVPIYVLVLVALALSLRRGGRADRAEDPGDRQRDERAIGRGLVGWTALIALLLTGLVGASFVADRDLNRAASAPLKIKVTARQWWWSVQYLDDDPSKLTTTANELHLPLGRDARIELASNDVIHSLWIPALSGKLDLIPGRTNVLVLTPTQAGRFRGQCAEFCGLQHAHMALDVVVEDEASFAAWRAHQLEPAKAPDSDETRAGQAVFLGAACATCHSIAGTTAAARNGPDLTHVASRASIGAGVLPSGRDALARWIEDPQRHKPGVNMPAVPLDARERDQLAAYLAELR